MKLLDVNGKNVNVEIGYVWDREDKYLVVVDNDNKVKYVVNTWSSTFNKESVEYLAYKFAIFISKGEKVCYSHDRKPARKICHNDDFCRYKKNYKTISPSECTELGLRY